MSDKSSLVVAGSEGGWTVSVRNRRVLKSWHELAERAPESTETCLRRLSLRPLERLPGRVFPMKHKAYRGVWEYEVTAGDRVFYIPNETDKTVLIYYAGKHLTPAPNPPHA